MTTSRTLENVSVDLGNGLWIRTVDIADLKEQDINAHVMDPAKFARLVENIRKRGAPESLVYCAQPKGEGTQIEIVSGHHRVRACLHAGLTRIPILLDTTLVTRSAIVAKQLAHNALVGSDDPEIIKRLLPLITSVDDMLETGLDPELLPTPEKFKVTIFTPHADYAWQTCTFVFLSHQLADFQALVKAVKLGDVVCTACEKQFEPFLRAVAAFAQDRQILSAATAVSVLTQTALEALGEESAAASKDGWLSLTKILGSASVPADVAAVVEQAIAKMLEVGDITEKARWRAIELWAANYLAGAP